VFSIGNFGLLAQYGIDWSKTKPLSRVREAHEVMRTFLDEGAINHDGEFYKYTGLFTFARPVQEHVPILVGAMRGPKSFRFAGEAADGVHHALSYSREAYDYLVENVRAGAEAAGRDWKQLDIGAWCVCVVSPDADAAREAARSMVGFYISSMPREQLARHGLDADELQPIVEALGRGAIDEAIELTSPDVAARLSLAGSPEEGGGGRPRHLGPGRVPRAVGVRAQPLLRRRDRPREQREPPRGPLPAGGPDRRLRRETALTPRLSSRRRPGRWPATPR
jgi:5,10-methylenetetrahydromethanopterin reductase